MTSRRVWKKLLLLLSVAAGLGTLVSASSQSGPTPRARLRGGS